MAITGKIVYTGSLQNSVRQVLHARVRCILSDEDGVSIHLKLAEDQERKLFEPGQQVTVTIDLPDDPASADDSRKLRMIGER